MAKAKASASKKTEVVKSVEPSDVPAVKKKRSNAIQLSVPKLSETSQNGNLLVCGANDVGQLGLDTDDFPEKTRPALVSQVRDLIDVKAGGMHSLCLVKDGTIWSFGCNDEGALGRDTSEEGSEMKPDKIELPTKAVKISAGDSHSACLLDDGRVYAWGSFRDSHGSMGLTLEGNKRSPIEVLPDIVSVDIASGNDHLVILAKNGAVFTIGCAEQGQLGRVSSRTLTGETRRGNTTMLKPGPIPKKAGKYIANAIWATPFCTFFRENSSGQVYGFGLNNYVQLGVVSKTKKVNDDAKFEPFPILTNFENIKSIAGGQHHTIILTEEGICYAIGRKDYGRLGLSDVTEDLTELKPITSLNGKKVSEICCGESNSFAVTKEGKVYVWGMGSAQLGTGDEDDVLEPKLLVSAQVKDKNILAVSSGGQHTLVLVEVIDNSPKAKKVAELEPVVSSTDNTEPQPKENGAAQKSTAAGAREKKKKVTAVIMESDSTTDVNGNSEKDEKMEVEPNPDEIQTAAKRGRKRKA